MADLIRADSEKVMRERMEKAKRIRELKLRVIRKVIATLDMKLLNPEKETSSDNASIRDMLEKAVYSVITGLGMPDDAGKRLMKEICDHMQTYSILSDYVLDPHITRILVNARDSIFIEENETMTMVKREFLSNAHCARAIQRIVRLGGGKITMDNPIADVSLEDGLWVTAALPPIAAPGPVMTIQKSGGREFSLDDLVDHQTLSRSIAQFMQACVEGRRNIIISGMTGSGRTTLLNTFFQLMPTEERVIVVEDRGELATFHPNCCFLRPRYSLTRQSNDLSPRMVLQTALRMRPDRIILGDCRGDETLDFLQAMSFGFKGCMTTCHAASPSDLISRLETLMLLSNEALSVKAVKNLILSSIDLIVHVERMNDKSRRITHITELTGMEGDILTRSDIYRFRYLGSGEDGVIEGIFEPTGIVPRFFQELQQSGIKIPLNIF